jgi:hypothetical protein
MSYSGGRKVCRNLPCLYNRRPLPHEFELPHYLLPLYDIPHHGEGWGRLSPSRGGGGHGGGHVEYDESIGIYYNHSMHFATNATLNLTDSSSEISRVAGNYSGANLRIEIYWMDKLTFTHSKLNNNMN